MPDLVLSTEKSLHKPLEVTINGKMYTLVKIPKSLFDKIIELQLGGDPAAGYEQVHLAFKIPKATLAKMDSRDVKLITNLLSDALIESDKWLSDAAKNELGPGKTS